MIRSLPLILLALLAVTACRSPEPPPAMNVQIAGWVIGADYEGNPITVSRNDLAGKPLVVTYFATW